MYRVWNLSFYSLVCVSFNPLSFPSLFCILNKGTHLMTLCSQADKAGFLGAKNCLPSMGNALRHCTQTRSISIWSALSCSSRSPVLYGGKPVVVFACWSELLLAQLVPGSVRELCLHLVFVICDKCLPKARLYLFIDAQPPSLSFQLACTF